MAVRARASKELSQLLQGKNVDLFLNDYRSTSDLRKLIMQGSIGLDELDGNICVAED
jgi:hypothetical protein